MTVQEEYLSVEDLGDTLELRGFMKSSKTDKYERDVRKEIKNLKSKANSKGKNWTKVHLDSDNTDQNDVVTDVLDDLGYQDISVTGGYIQAEKKL